MTIKYVAIYSNLKHHFVYNIFNSEMRLNIITSCIRKVSFLLRIKNSEYALTATNLKKDPSIQ